MRAWSVTSVVSNSVTLWPVACHALCPWGFSRQESWSGLPFPPPGELPHPGIEQGIDPHPCLLQLLLFRQILYH